MAYRGYALTSTNLFQKRAAEWHDEYRKKRLRTTPMVLAKLTEEVGEVAGCYYRGETQAEEGLKAGVVHPEGLGSELADVVINSFILANNEGIDLGREIEVKMRSLEARLDHKKEKKHGK